MRWKREGVRDLRIVEIEPAEEEILRLLLQEMRCQLADARSITKRLEEDVLGRGYLRNRRLSRQETLAQLSTWCHASGKHQKVKPYAQEVSKFLFAGRILDRLISKNQNQASQESEGLLDGFIEQVVVDQDDYTYKAPLWLTPGEGPDIESETGNEEEVSTLEPPTSVSLECDLRQHIAHDPTVIEPGLRLCQGGEEYTTDVGRMDVLCEDHQGHLVVVELKKGRSGDRVVGQILRYMGWLKREKGREVRGVIVMGQADERTAYAVDAVPNLKVVYYRVRFEIGEEPPT